MFLQDKGYVHVVGTALAKVKGKVKGQQNMFLQARVVCTVLR